MQLHAVYHVALRSYTECPAHPRDIRLALLLPGALLLVFVLQLHPSHLLG